ncbi:hypothetical protein [Tautonia plasticadhaerens]|uniref:Uncharacterized protein n=1 Tax=Tautonia plasticadhaerens TaxID=2527974 RepID=A0A518HCP3_9BACT|nr:hypothetical protein [Tautonia plasticadhaerens]QDV38617.1 hypothetical protein ElP_65720 [Tautonia plasticadhaerens]
MGHRGWGRIGALFLLGMLLALPGSARGEERYYVLIFGSQSHPKLPRYTHTWATFVRAVGEGPDPSGWAIEHHTISWLPTTLDVRVWNLVPEPGINLDLDESIGAVRSTNQRIAMWGPFQIVPQVYARSLGVRTILESGAAQYRAISTPRNLLISDCIHAVAACDPIFGRDHYPLIRIGKPASRFIAREVMTRSPFDQAANDNAWLIARLGLDRYPVEVVPPSRIPKKPCFLCRCPE